MRRYVIAGNWKMNMTPSAARAFIKELAPMVAGKDTCQHINVETDGQNPQHIGVLNAFAAAILRDEPMVADGREGLNGLLLSNAMHLSAWTGKEIEIPLNEQLFKNLLDEKVKTSRRKENTKYVFSEFDKNHGNLCFV